MSPAVSFMVFPLRLFQQLIQVSVGLERLQVIASADMALADEDLRYGIAAAARAHLLACTVHRFDIDLKNGDPFGLEQAPCAHAVRAPVRDVNNDLRRTHQARWHLRRARAAGCPRARPQAPRAART